MTSSVAHAFGAIATWITLWSAAGLAAVQDETGEEITLRGSVRWPSGELCEEGKVIISGPSGAELLSSFGEPPAMELPMWKHSFSLEQGRFTRSVEADCIEVVVIAEEERREGCVDYFYARSDGPFDGRELDLVLSAGPRLAGKVVDRQGKAVTKFRLVALPGSAERPKLGLTVECDVQNENGEFSVSLARDGYWHALVQAPGYTPTMLVTSMPRSKPVNPVLSPAAQVMGTVIDPSGKPVAGAKVWAGPTGENGVFGLLGVRNLTTLTDDEGGFAFEGVPAGPVLLQALWKSPPSTAHSLVLEPGERRGGVVVQLAN